MKKITFLFVFSVIFTAFAVEQIEFILRDGEVLRGYFICQDRVNITLRTQSSTVSVNQRNIRYFNGEDITGGTGRRHFVIPDSLLLVNKNEISFINASPDIARIRLRQVFEAGREELFGEQIANQGDTVIFFVPDGRFYEAVEFTRIHTDSDEREVYFGIGRVFEKNNRCNTFSRDEIELRGFPLGQRVPQLVGDRNNFLRDGY